jgi:hypothetical protein
METNTKLNAFDRFLNFPMANLSVFPTLSEGDRIYYSEDEQTGAYTFYAYKINRNSLSGWGHIFQDAEKHFWRPVGYIDDTNKVLDKVILFFSDIESIIIGLAAALDQIEKENPEDLTNPNSELNIKLLSIKERLKIVKESLKAGSLGVNGLIMTAIKGTGKEKQALIYSSQSRAMVRRFLKCDLLEKKVDDLLGISKDPLLNNSQIVESSEPGFLEAVWNNLPSPGDVATGACQLISGRLSPLYNGTHPAKLHKWQVFLLEIGRGLETNTKMTLNDMIINLNSFSSTNPDLQEFVNLTKEALLELKATYIRQVLGDDKRTVYRNFGKKFRHAIKCPGYKAVLENYTPDKKLPETPELALKIMLNLGFARFTANINAFCEYTLRKLGVPKYSTHHLDIVEMIKKGLQNNPELRSSRLDKGFAMAQALLTGFDPYATSNAPFALGTFKVRGLNGKIKTLIQLRMGTPTIDFKSHSIINPELRSLLDYCKVNNLKLFSICLQSQMKHWFENEYHRNDAQLNEVKNYRGNYIVIVLDNDSKEYHEGDVTDFFPRLIAKDKGYVFPNEWLEDLTFQKLLNEAIKVAKKIVGTDTPALGREGKDFLEHFNALLGCLLPVYADADIVNDSCKDDADRGPKYKRLKQRLIAIAQGIEDQEMHWMNDVQLHTPVILNKGQPINKRVQRLITADARLDDTDVKALLRNPKHCSLSTFYPEKFSCPKVEGQLPGEEAFIKFNDVLTSPVRFDKKTLDFLVDGNYLKELAEDCIYADYFTIPEIDSVLKHKLDNGFQELLYKVSGQIRLAFDNRKLAITDVDHLKRLISEMIFITFLRPVILETPRELATQAEILTTVLSQFTFEHLCEKLTEICADPKGFLDKNPVIKQYFNSKKSIAQKIFWHTLMNISNPQLQYQILNDKLFKAIENSPCLLDFMSIFSETPLNIKTENLIPNVQKLSNALEMLVFGEQVVLKKIRNRNEKIGYEESIAEFEKMMFNFDSAGITNSLYLDGAIEQLAQIRNCLEDLTKIDEYSYRDGLSKGKKIAFAEIKNYIPHWQETMSKLQYIQDR